jgi:hypothetical protein
MIVEDLAQVIGMDVGAVGVSENQARIGAQVREHALLDLLSLPDAYDGDRP